IFNDFSCCLFSFLNTDGHTDAEVHLNVPRYVERGTSATLECIHDVEPIVLFKVSWFRDEVKFFEYVKGRKLPFKNFTLDGADIDWEYSNESQVTLANVDFKLSGQFHCEVSMTSPLYTKASSEHLMSVFCSLNVYKENETPGTIGSSISICHVFYLLCREVDEKYVRTHHVYSLNGKTHRRSQQQQEQELEIQQAKQKKQQMSKMPDSQQFYSQQQQQYNHIYQLPFHLPHLLTDRYDKSLRWSGNRPIGM
uniref:Ig-like domain-containing protein n=1 Tax=Glossina brevipalpis TaxID=37001 RepID=A0A1A9WLQ7_9MUSC